MKSIEERAKEFALSASDTYCGNCGICSTKCEDYRRYVDIATEQRDIDIENACEACENELRRLKRLLDESVGVPSNLISVGKPLSEIIRKMKE